MNTALTQLFPALTGLRRSATLGLLILTALLPSLASAQSAPAADAAIMRSEEGFTKGYFHNRHLEGVGLIIWDEKAVSGRSSVFGLTRQVPNAEKSAPGSIPSPILKSQRQDGTLDGLVVIARMQNSLDVDESKAQAATYQWIRDAQAGSFWNVDAAAIVDWYLPVKPSLNWIAYRPQQFAAHLRTGIAWERITAGSAASSVDLREAFVGIGFHLKPLNPENLKNFQHQSKFQIGFSYKDNAITNDSQWGVDLNVQPVFRFLPQFFKDKLPFAIGEHWLLHKSDRDAAANAAATPSELKASPNLTAPDANSTLESRADHLYIKPNFTLKSVFSDFVKNTGKVSPGAYQVDWGNRVGFGFLENTLRLSYQISGVSPLEQIDRSFIFQEARVEFGPFRDFPGVFSARYTKGKRAPSYVNEDRVILAVGIKF